MKKGTSRHPKVPDLARRLNIPVPYALGLLQYLWDFAEDFAPRGDIGKFTDGTIAENCRWQKQPEALVLALIDAKWIDKHETHRLLVHDWPEHCENTVHNKLARARQLFADGSVPILTRLGKDERAHAERFYSNLRAHAEQDSCARETRSRAPIPQPVLEPVLEPMAARTPSASTNGNGYHPSDDLWPYVRDAYPGEVNDENDVRLLLSVIQTPDDEAVLRKNLPLWVACERWSNTRYVPKLENFLAKRQFKSRPKAVVERNPHEIEYPNL